MLNLSVCCICFSNTLKLTETLGSGNTSVCCICFSNTLKRTHKYTEETPVCVVFVLAIPSNSLMEDKSTCIVCVVFVLAIPSNSLMEDKSTCIVCVVFVLAIPSNYCQGISPSLRCVLYLF